MAKKTKYIKRIDRMIGGHRMQEKISGDGAFMCPVCKSISYLKMKSNIDLQNVDHPECEILFGVTYQITCYSCHSEFTADDPMDPNIAPIISLLNKKGYQTKFCCEGHSVNDNKPGSLFYIFFKDTGYYDHIENSLPDKFYIDHNSYKQGKLIIRAKVDPDDKGYPGINKMMKTLMKWAKSLPDISD